MSIRRRIQAAALALSLLGATALPCSLSAVRASAPLASLQGAMSLHVLADGHEMQRTPIPDCHEQTRATLEAPCPCGCSDRANPSPSNTRLGDALLASLLEPEEISVLLVPIEASLEADEAPVRSIDHVPWA